jgi:hypothetical protein
VDAEGTIEDQKCPRCGTQPLPWRRLRPGERAGLDLRAGIKSAVTVLTSPANAFRAIAGASAARRVGTACEKAHPEWKGSSFPALIVICPFCGHANRHVVFGAKCINCGNEYL